MTWKKESIDITIRGIATGTATSISIQEEKRKQREEKERREWREKYNQLENEPTVLVIGKQQAKTS